MLSIVQLGLIDIG